MKVSNTNKVVLSKCDFNIYLESEEEIQAFQNIFFLAKRMLYEDMHIFNRTKLELNIINSLIK